MGCFRYRASVGKSFLKKISYFFSEKCHRKGEQKHFYMMVDISQNNQIKLKIYYQCSLNGKNQGDKKACLTKFRII